MTKITFKNGQAPYINDTNLNQMQTNIETAINLKLDKSAMNQNDESKKLASSIVKAITPTNATNYATYGNSYYYKVGTKVHLHIGVKMNNTDFNKIYTLPAGYRPYSRIGEVTIGSNLDVIGGIQIDTDGTINGKSGTNYILADIEFDAFN